MNPPIDELKDKINRLATKIKDESKYTIGKARTLAIDSTRRGLEIMLEEAMCNPRQQTDLLYLTARLTLFNSIFR